MTKAIILAAGEGTRLRPYTHTKPKCLVPLLGKALLIRQVETLKASGISNIHVVTGYLYKQIEALGFDITINKNFHKTNMVSSLFCAEEFIQGTEDLIISYGDIIYQIENLNKLLKSNDDISLLIDFSWQHYWESRFDDPLDDAETLRLDGSNYVQEIGKKPSSYRDIDGQYTGLIKIKGEKINNLIKFYHLLDKTKRYDGQSLNNMYMTSFLQSLIDEKWTVKAIECHNGWLELDTVDDLKLYERMYADKTLKKFIAL